MFTKQRIYQMNEPMMKGIPLGENAAKSSSLSYSGKFHPKVSINI
jgi:hypothetical protein